MNIDSWSNRDIYEFGVAWRDVQRLFGIDRGQVQVMSPEWYKQLRAEVREANDAIFDTED